MLVGVGDHLPCPEIAVPAGKGKEQCDGSDGGLAHGDVHFPEHLEFGGTVHDGRFFNFAGHAFKGISQKDDVHGRHTHGDDHQPFIVGDAHGVENVLGGQVVQVLGHKAGGEKHGKHQEEVKSPAEQKPLFGKGIGTQNGHKQGPHRAVEGKEQCVGIGIPEHIVIKHLGKGIKLDILGEQHHFAIVHRMGTADGSGNGIEEGVQTGQGEKAQERVADHLKNAFRYFKLSFHLSPLLSTAKCRRPCGRWYWR